MSWVLIAAALTIGNELPPSSPWAEMTRNDLLAAHEAILTAHVGPVDTENPQFSQDMEAALSQGLERAEAVTDWFGYRFTMMGYADAFADGHLAISFRVERPWVRWPGFHVIRRGGRSMIYATDHADHGAEVISCDGLETVDLITATSAQFYGAGDFEGALARATPYAFLDEANPFFERPSTCQIRFDDTTEETRALNWVWQDAREWRETLQTAHSGPETLKLETPRPGTYWLSIPDFNPTAAQTADYESLIETLHNSAEALQNAERIVIDVRGNPGGNSDWARRIVNAIWTQDAIEAAAGGAQRSVTWRASTISVNRMTTLVNWYTDQSNEHLTTYYSGIREGLSSALKAGQPLWNEPAPAGNEAITDTIDNPVQADVIVLIDEGCASSCLNLLDMLRPMSGVRFAGAPSYADSVYNEGYQVSLPSSIAVLNHPIKVIRGGARGHNEPYEPDLPYNGLDWSQEALLNWLEDLNNSE